MNVSLLRFMDQRVRIKGQTEIFIVLGIYWDSEQILTDGGTFHHSRLQIVKENEDEWLDASIEIGMY